MDKGVSTTFEVAQDQKSSQTCQCIDWYHEGSSRTVEIGGIQITVRFVARNGRRVRIAIVAPGGAVFRETSDGKARSA